MKTSIDQDGTFSVEIQIIEEVLGLIDKIYESTKGSKIEKFRATIGFMHTNRGKLKLLAKEYYKAKGNTLIHPEIPLLIDGCQFDFQLRDISEIKLEYTNHRTEIQQNLVDLPDNKKSYIENIIENLYKGDTESSPYHNNLCYRLIEIVTPTELKFEKCNYFDYINSCEYQFYLFTNQLAQKYNKNKNFKIDKIRRKIDPIDFKNRYLVAGINTLLILWDDNRPLIYIHQRSKKNIAEAVNTKHVVPAGTFQPIHINDGNHKIDFNLYVNIMREFGEELVGDEEVIHPNGTLENVLDRESIKKVHHLFKRGLGKLFYGGIALDCLTLKPEILTIMILRKEDYLTWIGDINFKKNYEGVPFAEPFTKERLKELALEEIDMLPAGAGCLWLAYENYDLINDYMKHLR